MEKIKLVSVQKAYNVYVKSYNAKTKELELTRDLSEAKVYKTRQGAESSARSIFSLFLKGKTEHIFNSGIFTR
jgi:hypothetical protein